MFDKGSYDKDYAKKHITRKFIPFNDIVQDDAVLLAWLNQQQNVTQYIKQLIRDDMKTGVWHFFEEPDEYYHYECSECGTCFSPVDWDKDKYKHCPHCGVKMTDS